MLLTESTPDPVPPELAPFVARAQQRLEQATQGLGPDETIAHLEAAVARAEVEASRLGFRFPSPELGAEAPHLGDDSSVVVIQRLTDADQAD